MKLMKPRKTRRTEEPEPDLKVLFLTSKLGYGHTRAADAVAAELRAAVPGASIHSLDLWSLMDERVAEATKDAYLRMVREAPDYYQRLYDLDPDLWRQLSGEKPTEPILRGFLRNQQQRWFPRQTSLFGSHGQNMDQALLHTLIGLICSSNSDSGINRVILRTSLHLVRGLLSNRLKEKINEIGPDVVVSTQMHPASLLAHLKTKRHFCDLPALGVVTDFVLHPAWLRPPTEYYCVPCTELADDLVSKGLDRERIHVTGIPVMPCFRKAAGQQQARRELGIPLDRHTVLITGGQYGIGTAEALADLQRSKNDYQLLVTTGRSASETDDLPRLAAEHPDQIRVFNWVEDMSLLLAAADVVVGKPGGLSVSEALACGRPFYATCCLGGQEKHNVDFITRNGVGALISPSSLSSVLAEVFATEDGLRDLQKRAHALGQRDAARSVAGLVLELSRRSKQEPARIGRKVPGSLPGQ